MSLKFHNLLYPAEIFRLQDFMKLMIMIARTILALALYFGAAAIVATDKVVSAKGGLKVRQEPDAKAKIITTLKEGTTVSVIEESGETITISGASGKWTKISSGNVTGWAFGGFLSAGASGIPKALWGRYCAEGSPKCGQAEYYIDGKMVWQSSEGGCGTVEKVEKNGDEFEVYCGGVKGVTLKPLSKGKIRLTITGSESQIIKKE